MQQYKGRENSCYFCDSFKICGLLEVFCEICYSCYFCYICYSIFSLSKISKKFVNFAFKSDTAVLTFTFRFLSSPLFSLFLPHFFSLAGHLVGFILVGKVFRKPLRILGWNERKGRWVVEQDFHGNFSGEWYMNFAFFSGVLDSVVLILVWF